ncbi:MAG: sigma-70 family RNA polymerase sigma factor [Puniceicoccales bacterium]|jgi:RNA polymerase sigma-70 factor (ECF subfamily)|nr:sigma-70 family RNA polymerase sigma factor [Puniceicoccales bacterium]
MPEASPQCLNEVEFSREIDSIRHGLSAYVLTLFPNQALADEILQDTMLFLWERRADFQPGTNFRAWAFSAARFKVLAKRRDLQREKKVCFSEELTEKIAGESDAFGEHADRRFDALKVCLELLPEGDLALLRLKYFQKKNLTALSSDIQKAANTIHKTLSRIRFRLKHCITKRLKHSDE